MNEQAQRDYAKAITQTIIEIQMRAEHARAVAEAKVAETAEAAARLQRERFDRSLAEWHRLAAGGKPVVESCVLATIGVPSHVPQTRYWVRLGSFWR